ncbi:HAAS signaling domain-containing protein [Specibacter cremeus]|uniref:HAAS signaling domain-containing protein n=1 Tax=Specibacter cremeus TaxID=1629051 RepID=UPI000F794265|nr:hypothetical protein [Specibacter cremeus]
MNEIKDGSKTPASAEQYLRALRRELRPLPRSEQCEVLNGIAAHIHETLHKAGHEETSKALAALGSPRMIAEQAFDDFESRTGRTARPRYLNAARALQIGAAALAVAATLAALLLPGVVRDTQINSGEHIVETLTLLQTHSAGILIPLAIPIVLTGLPLAVIGSRWRATSIACTILLAVFAVIASATVGWFYSPAFIVAIVAVSIPLRSKV